MAENLEEPPLRLQIILGVGASSIGIGGSLLTFFITTNLLNLRFGDISLLATFRVLMVFMYFIVVLPSSILGEYWWSQTRKKPFKSKRIAFNAALLGVVLIFMAFLSYALETLFPKLDYSAQVPVLGASVALGLLIPALIARTSTVDERLRKMYS